MFKLSKCKATWWIVWPMAVLFLVERGGETNQTKGWQVQQDERKVERSEYNSLHVEN